MTRNPPSPTDSLSEPLYTAYADSPLGLLMIRASDQAIIELLPVSRKEQEIRENSLTSQCRKELSQYFAGKRKNFTLPLRPRGTPFQKKIWTVLQTIPYGCTMTYKEIAEKAGNPKAVRAAGTACGKNPLPILIPCHRVIGSNGSLIGYAFGLPAKKYLLSLEKNDIAPKDTGKALFSWKERQ